MASGSWDICHRACRCARTFAEREHHGQAEVLELIDVHAGTTARLDEAYGLHRLWQASDPKKFVAEVGPGVRAAVTNGIVGMKGELIAALPALEIIGVFGVGVDAVDQAVAKARGVRVTNTPDVLTEGVAELAIALLLAVARRIPFNDRFVRAGRWPKEGDPALELACGPATRHRRPGPHRAQGRRAGGSVRQVISYTGPRRRRTSRRYYGDPVQLARAVDCLMLTCKGAPIPPA